MKTGIVLEIHNKKAVIMQTGGAFITVDARTGWKEGDAVSFKNGQITMQSIYAAAACIILVFFIGAGGFRLYYTETSVVSLDINPSIELGINRFDRVIRVSDFNGAGLEIIDSVRLINKTYAGAVGELLTAEPLSNYISDDEVWVKVAVHSDIPAKNDNIKQAITKKAESLPAKKNKFRIDCAIVTAEQVKEAHEHEMTPGKYVEILELVELMPETVLDDCRDMSIKALKELKAPIAGVLSDGGAHAHEAPGEADEHGATAGARDETVESGAAGYAPDDANEYTETPDAADENGGREKDIDGTDEPGAHDAATDDITDGAGRPDAAEDEADETHANGGHDASDEPGDGGGHDAAADDFEADGEHDAAAGNYYVNGEYDETADEADGSDKRILTDDTGAPDKSGVTADGPDDAGIPDENNADGETDLTD